MFPGRNTGAPEGVPPATILVGSRRSKALRPAAIGFKHGTTPHGNMLASSVRSKAIGLRLGAIVGA
jgi:hypothetical protein